MSTDVAARRESESATIHRPKRRPDARPGKMDRSREAPSNNPLDINPKTGKAKKAAVPVGQKNFHVLHGRQWCHKEPKQLEKNGVRRVDENTK